MEVVIIFIIAFFAPFVFFRLVIFLVPRKYITDPFLTRLSSVRFHHPHYGMLLILAGSIILIVFGRSLTVIWLLGLGLGTVFDVFVMTLMIEKDRQKGFEVYLKSLNKTFILFFIVALIVLGLALFFKI